MSEKILAFKNNLLQGKYDSLYFRYIYDNSDVLTALNNYAIDDWDWKDRDSIEKDENYRQPIVYTILSKTPYDYSPEVFTYLRKGSEKRLTSKISIGLGGHVNPEDGKINSQYTICETLKQSAIREIFEEIDFVQMKNGTMLPINEAWYKLNLELNFKALLGTKQPSDKTNIPVGNVHLAFVADVQIPSSVQNIIINEGTSLGFQSVSELKAASNVFSDNIESWSRIALEHLFNH